MIPPICVPRWVQVEPHEERAVKVVRVMAIKYLAAARPDSSSVRLLCRQNAPVVQRRMDLYGVALLFQNFRETKRKKKLMWT